MPSKPISKARHKAGAVATVSLDRLGTPDDLVFLASYDSAYVTGVELFVDGGAGQY
jgi:NAD(P)-dependent dehydrogenase (short-subunit alcohol dehydrogenase family)